MVSYNWVRQAQYGAKANAINADGTIVLGTSRNENNVEKAFIWTQMSGMLDLFDVLEANNLDLSDWDTSNQSYIKTIAGDYILGSAIAKNGEWADFVVDLKGVAIPEPSSLLLISASTLLLLKRRANLPTRV